MPDLAPLNPGPGKGSNLDNARIVDELVDEKILQFFRMDPVIDAIEESKFSAQEEVLFLINMQRDQTVSAGARLNAHKQFRDLVRETASLTGRIVQTKHMKRMTSPEGEEEVAEVSGQVLMDKIQKGQPDGQSASGFKGTLLAPDQDRTRKLVGSDGKSGESGGEDDAEGVGNVGESKPD